MSHIESTEYFFFHFVFLFHCFYPCYKFWINSSTMMVWLLNVPNWPEILFCITKTDYMTWHQPRNDTLLIIDLKIFTRFDSDGWLIPIRRWEDSLLLRRLHGICRKQYRHTKCMSWFSLGTFQRFFFLLIINLTTIHYNLGKLNHTKDCVLYFKWPRTVNSEYK